MACYYVHCRICCKGSGLTKERREKRSSSCRRPNDGSGGGSLSTLPLRWCVTIRGIDPEYGDDDDGDDEHDDERVHTVLEDDSIHCFEGHQGAKPTPFLHTPRMPCWHARITYVARYGAVCLPPDHIVLWPCRIQWLGGSTTAPKAPPDSHPCTVMPVVNPKPPGWQWWHSVCLPT